MMRKDGAEREARKEGEEGREGIREGERKRENVCVSLFSRSVGFVILKAAVMNVSVVIIICLYLRCFPC